MPDLHSDKIEIQHQWDRDPCAAESVRNVPRGTLEYYRAIRNHRYEVYAPWMRQAMAFSEWRGKRTLEIGVGLGSDHYMLAKGGNRMTALDLSREHLKLTKQHLGLEGLETDTVYGDAEDMPFEDDSFDLVYSFGVLHHTPDTEKAFREVERVLRPGGVALIGVYHKYSWFFIVHTLLVNGLVRRRLFRKGYRQLLSDIEYRSQPGTATPVVKVFGRMQLRKYFRRYSKCRVTAHHVEFAHIFGGHFSRILQRPSANPAVRRRLERYLGWGGWYLIARAVK